MCHPVLPQPNDACATSRHGAQAVVSVGDTQTGRELGEESCGFQQNPASRRYSIRAAQEPASQREIHIGFPNCLDQLLNVHYPVLTVGIERHDDVGSPF